MKKDLIFAPVLAIIGAALSFLKLTGMTAHIIISVVGVAVLVAYTVLTKGEWKIPALEIVMRAFYGIALITGIVLMKVQGVVALAMVHKIAALLFAAVLIVLIVYKTVTSKKA